MSDVAIRVERLGKRYRIGQRERYYALRDVLARSASRLLRRRRDGAPDPERRWIWALRDVSFQVKEGEVVGIIGRNGAGKTTLLKILARITKPTEGRAEVRGRVGSLLEVGTGFHPELTGRENVYLSGAVLGMTRREIERKFDEIVDFAGVERFIDTPLKYYSQGMQTRLAFAVAAHLDPEILLVDEVLAVGDIEFQRKCLGKMQEVSAEGGRTVLFVSHQMNQIRRLCQRCMWINRGKVAEFGPTPEVAARYEAATIVGSVDEVSCAAEGRQAFRFLWWEVLDPKADQHNVVCGFGPVRIRFRAQVNRPIQEGIYVNHLRDVQNQIVWSTSEPIRRLAPGLYDFVHEFPMLPVQPGAYQWHAGVYDGHEWIEGWWGVPELLVVTPPVGHSRDEYRGLLNIPCVLSIQTARNRK